MVSHVNESRSKNTSGLHDDFHAVKNLVYDKCGFEITDIRADPESRAYGACHYSLNSKAVIFRVAKVTPTKTGQFVTLWKRDPKGITQPFDVSDTMDFIVVATRYSNNFGQFIFPKSVLAEKGIIANNGREGKRGIRVYTPWDTVSSQQAAKTQNWQTRYFLAIKHNTTDLDLARRLFS